MDGIDGNNPIGAQNQADSSLTVERSAEKTSDAITDQEMLDAWEPAAMAVIQGSIFYLFPEARRIQERAQAYNKEMLQDS